MSEQHAEKRPVDSSASDRNPIGTGRREAFSDGVIAIVVTLLVLEIRIPPGLPDQAALVHALRGIVPAAVAWIVSFSFVLVFWVNHHYFCASLRRADRGLLLMNGLLLLCISATPFPTGLVGEYPGQAVPLMLMSLSMFATSLSFSLMRVYATWHDRLTRRDIPQPVLRRAARYSLIAPPLFLLAAALAFVWAPGSLILQIFVIILYAVRPAGRHQGNDFDAHGER